MLRMELSWGVKGYLADLIARERLGKIQIIGMRVGIDPGRIKSILEPIVILNGEHDPYEGMSSNEKAALYLIEHTGNPNLLIETILDTAKRGGIGGKWHSEIYDELNSVMERTMQCRMDERGNIIPILDENLQISEKQTFIERKLEEFGFNKTLTNYRDALNTYKTSYKGSISLLRSTFESLVDEIIELMGEPLHSNQKDKLVQLEKLGFIKEIDTQQCQNCQHKKKDSEFNYSYDIYSLLSHYGSHKELLTEEVANFLFTSTLASIWLLINRYENMETK